MRKLFQPNLNHRPRKTRTNLIVFFVLVALAIAFAVSLSGCSPSARVRHIMKRNPELAMKEFVHDSIITKDSIIIHHDTIRIAGEEIVIHDTIPFKFVYHKSVTKGHLTETVDIHDGKLTADCKADSLQQVIESQWEMITTLKFHNKQAQLPPVIEYVNHWYTVPAYWLSIIFLLLIAFFVGKRFVKF